MIPQEALVVMHLFENARVPVCLINPLNGCIEDINQAGCNLTGYGKDYLIGLEIWMVGLEREKKVRQILSDCIEKRGGHFQSVYRTEAGSLREIQVEVLILGKTEDCRVLFIMKDITEENLNFRRAQENQRKFQHLLRDIPSISVQGYKMDGTTFFWNKASEQLYGFSREEALGKSLLDLIIPPEMRKEVEASIERMIESKVAEPAAELRLMRKDHSLVDVFSSHALLHFPPEEPELFCLDIDISEQKIARQLNLAASVFTYATEPIMILDGEGNVVNINSAFTETFGYTLDEMKGHNPRILQSGVHDRGYYEKVWESVMQNDTWTGELYDKTKSGQLIPELVRINTVRDANGKITNYVGFFTDLTLIKQQEEDLKRVAYYDALTGLPNRILLDERIKMALTGRRKNGEQVAIVYIDLDGFKNINDTYGHEAGDQFLRGVSANMQKQLREEDTLARLGGDEFVAVLDRIGSETDCCNIVERLLEGARRPVVIGGDALAVTASIGVSMHPEDGESADQLMQKADIAMYHAKNVGKNQYRLFGKLGKRE